MIWSMLKKTDPREMGGLHVAPLLVERDTLVISLNEVSDALEYVT